jgi:hypothetical protein
MSADLLMDTCCLLLYRARKHLEGLHFKVDFEGIGLKTLLNDIYKALGAVNW